MGKRIRYLEFLAASAMLIVCCGGNIYGVLPFGTAMFCALSGEFFIGFLAPIYIACSFLFTFELWRLYMAGAVVFITALRWFLALKVPKLNGFVAKTFFSLGAIVVDAVLLGVFRPIAEAVSCGFIGVVFYYFAVRAAAAASNKFSFRLSVIDAVSVCAVFVAAGLAFGRASFGIFDIGLALGFFAALMLSEIGSSAVLTCGISMGLGLAATSGLNAALAFIACSGALAAFRGIARPLRALIGIGTFAAVAVLFYADPVRVGIGSAMLACGALPICLVPRRTVKAIRGYFDFDGSARLAVRHYINRVKADAGARMLAVASVFDETARLMNGFGAAAPDFSALGAVMMDGICPYCPKNATCDRERASAAFTAVAERAYGGGSVLMNMPDFLSDECIRTVDISGAAAELASGAAARARERAGEDKAKAIVTERLTAIKDVLENLGDAEAQPVGFDGKAEKAIAAELNLCGIECAEAFCTRAGVTAIVRTSTATREKISRAVSACQKREYAVTALEKTQAAGWSVATLKRKPAYEAAYARAGVAKDGVSGDSYSFQRIGDKFLVALVDGMGSGAGASETSAAAVELIECFYKAGFDSQSVLSGVNRFLKLPTTENYSAADVAVCDLDGGTVDIIKIGSPPCYIKTTDTVLKIEGSSLPIGVLDEMRPYVTAKRMYPGQMLIMVTDGVSDRFTGDELPEFINGLSAFNPEAVVNAIMQRALDLGGETVKDDMTAIAFRLFDAPKRKFIIKKSELRIKCVRRN